MVKMSALTIAKLALSKTCKRMTVDTAAAKTAG
jgi:hypothetical protein